jgi:hypothetical protein
MTKFISREKMSKKARKELDGQKRIMWEYSPVTKIAESKKHRREKYPKKILENF